ncbi:gamma-glutamyltranspeptidase periplasmic precursor [Fusarium austroafricanum]|uniref:Gamma-glutamyltranspeptidase periplasmic n=1 Tax=Fusarium austroafricanum TaxID=2364996 RepID=A0A8H4KQC4_9HYPO|nr:gamma-glutamyltranspeptidase periplasmic precursor [Fusarium austroafricanum]
MDSVERLVNDLHACGSCCRRSPRRPLPTGRISLFILDAPIRVPVVSDILEAVFPNFKILSFLYLICWIAAMSFTVVYTAIEKSPPFPKDNGYVQVIISAGTWEELVDEFGKSGLSLQRTLFKANHSTAAFLGLVGNPISSAEAMAEVNSLGTLSTCATVIKVVIAGSQAISDLLVSRFPVKNEVAKKISFMSAADPRRVEAIADVILVLPRLAITGWHFYELTKDIAGETLTADILGEVSNLATHASKISYAVAVNDEDPDSRLIAVTSKAAFDDLYSGLQVAESVVGFS